MNTLSLSNEHAHWAAHFTRERERLLTALGPLTGGGVVEGIQHIGATSVPNLPAQPCVDIAIAAWPFPLEEQPRAALHDLGYEPLASHTDAPEQRFRHTADPIQLFVVEPGTNNWTDHLLLRDYLSNAPGARKAYADLKHAHPLDSNEYRAAKDQWLAAAIESARRWWIDHTGFTPVQRIAQELASFTGTWYISSGWALDLFLDRVTRVHHDVDVVVARAQQLVVRDYLAERGWKLITPYEQRLEPWPPHMTLELPRHQAHAHRDGDFIDILLTDIEPGVWRYRRDPAIVRTIERVGLQHTGLPYLAPELVLLFKSKNTSNKPRPQDQADFEAVCAHLEPERRAWLRWALTATDPLHPWIAQLT